MTSARESAEVISRGCRSCPEAIRIWLKWKLAIDRFWQFSLPLCVFSWTAAIAQSDGFVFVTPEYNYGPSTVLKNAIDWVYPE
jgi:NAD(P)H-dependent FMN reductase